ncbi:hypothetical protein JCGZ_18797 [Jatropha curcas]|uniref:Uncharacterized protein n=1 Tax=Jatropha curcas TaxID=180498 RepID=A0A067KBK3_JATCU|nr:hypothetical protein JCGZ_18797 [Jatropha curcas]
MGGNYRQNKNSSPFFSVAFHNIFKSRRGGLVEDSDDDVSHTIRTFRSDEDGRVPGRVADPQIDMKTSDFLARNHAKNYESYR